MFMPVVIMLLCMMRESDVACYETLVACSISAVDHEMIFSCSSICRYHNVVMMHVGVTLAGKRV